MVSIFYSKAKKKYIRFGLERFEKLYFQEVFTYTEQEFEDGFYHLVKCIFAIRFTTCLKFLQCYIIKGRTRFEKCKIFFIGLHIHLILSILVIVVLFIDQWGTLGTSFWLLFVYDCRVVIIGWIMVIMAALANKKQKI